MSAATTSSRKPAKGVKTILWVAVALAIVFLIALAFRPQPTPADFAQVERGDLLVTIDDEGETRVRDRFLVSAPFPGRVLRIELEPGDPVVAGETVLATFRPSDPRPLDARSRSESEARVEAAQATLGRARADRDRVDSELRFRRTELERYRRLAEEGIAASDTLERFTLDMQTSEKSLVAAEFAVASAERDLDVARAALLQTVDGAADDGSIELRSPIDGVVLRRLRESAAVVPAGEVLLEIADPARLEIVSDLLSSDAVRVEKGDRVLVEQWGGEQALTARVRRVEPQGFTKISALGVEEQRVNVVMDFTDSRDAWQKLGDGYRVEVRIVIDERVDVLLAPTSSLFREESAASVDGGEGGHWAAFVVDDGVASVREIGLGARTGLRAEVVSGLEEGEQLIDYPGDAIVDGVQVVERPDE